MMHGQPHIKLTQVNVEDSVPSSLVANDEKLFKIVFFWAYYAIAK